MSLDNARLVIDRKRRLEELCQNCGRDSERFKAEIMLAKELGIKLIILVEHGPLITCIDDIRHWNNPLLKTQPNAMTGTRLAYLLTIIRNKYDIEFQFCAKYHTGKRIIQILSEGKHNGHRKPYHINIGKKEVTT